MSDITGKLILAGEYADEGQLGSTPLARVVIVMPQADLAAVERLPMYEEVAVVKVAELDEAKTEIDRLHDAFAFEQDRAAQATRELVALRDELTEAKSCLGYAVPGDFLPRFGLKCGLCEAQEKQLVALRVENTKLTETLDCHHRKAAEVRAWLYNGGAGPNYTRLMQADILLCEIAGLPPPATG
jgi:hypothetical protein